MIFGRLNLKRSNFARDDRAEISDAESPRMGENPKVTKIRASYVCQQFSRWFSFLGRRGDIDVDGEDVGSAAAAPRCEAFAGSFVRSSNYSEQPANDTRYNIIIV